MLYSTRLARQLERDFERDLAHCMEFTLTDYGKRNPAVRSRIRWQGFCLRCCEGVAVCRVITAIRCCTKNREIALPAKVLIDVVHCSWYSDFPDHQPLTRTIARFGRLGDCPKRTRVDRGYESHLAERCHSRSDARRVGSGAFLFAGATANPQGVQPVSHVEKMRVALRLRAQILVGRSHASTEMGGCMPWPARIVENCAGQRDHIGIASAYYGFRLIISRN